jgi:RNA polymerase sigma-70 factor (ECF subfamily)
MGEARDGEWFLDQVEQEQARLRAFIRSLGVRAEAVDDLAQDALVVAFQKRATFDPAIQHDFGVWVRGIARKLVANALRKQARRRVFVCEDVSALLLVAEAGQLHPLADTGVARLAALSTCLGMLPERSRELIHLRYFEDLSPGAMAGRLARTANDVRQALFRIRATRLACLERHAGEATE